VERVWRTSRLPFSIAASRIAIGVVFAHLVLTLFPQSRQHLAFGTLSNGTWFGAFDRWDSAYYTEIASHGYLAGQPGYSAFFPGYPALIWCVHTLTFGSLSYLRVGILVSWVSLVAASILLYRLTRRHFDERAALIATGLFCWFPASLFFLAPYSEALLVLELLVVVTLLDKKWFLVAALIAGYATATSPEAIVLIVAIVAAACLSRRGVARVAGYAAVSCAGLVAYGGYLWARYGSPIEFDKVQKLWHRSENPPFFGLYRNVVALLHYFQGPGPAPGGVTPTFTNVRYTWLFDDTALVVAAIATIGFAVLAARPWLERRRLGPAPASTPAPFSIPSSFLIIAVGIMLIGACTTIYPYGASHFASTEGEARFVSVVFPIYIAGGYLLRRRPALLFWVLGSSVAAALLFQALYNLGYWVT
jgi:hypothetical protein